MKIRIVSLFLLLALFVSVFAACGGKNAPTLPGTGDTTGIGTATETDTSPETTGTTAEETSSVLPEPERIPFPEEMRFANDLMDTASEELTTYFVRPSGAGKKSDGFIFVYRNEIWVLDGGRNEKTAGSAYDYLISLRASLLTANGIDAQDDTYRLKVNFIISHFHSDHIGALLNQLLPSGLLAVDHIYYPEDSAFSHSEYLNDPAVCDANSYGDTKYRPTLRQLLDENHPWAAEYVIPFGKTHEIRSTDGKLTLKLYAPSKDWGAGKITERESPLSRLAVMYYKYNATLGTTTSTSAVTGLPTAIVNSNSMWLKVTYGNRSMLFTGDVMKKISDSYTYGEPFDDMLAHYGYPEFDVDLAKFPHHGESRNAATNGVLKIFTPEILIFTIDTQTVSAQTTSVWLGYSGVWYDTMQGLFVITDGNYMKVSLPGEDPQTVIG